LQYPARSLPDRGGFAIDSLSLPSRANTPLGANLQRPQKKHLLTYLVANLHCRTAVTR
jgi:hypothetical protein